MEVDEWVSGIRSCDQSNMWPCGSILVELVVFGFARFQMISEYVKWFDSWHLGFLGPMLIPFWSQLESLSVDSPKEGRHFRAALKWCVGCCESCDFVGQCFGLQCVFFVFESVPNPRCSMSGIFTYIWVIFRANVLKYSIHGASGKCKVRVHQLIRRFWWFWVMIFFLPTGGLRPRAKNIKDQDGFLALGAR
jgi:hypothetical protein